MMIISTCFDQVLTRILLTAFQLGKSAVTRLYLVGDGGDIADTEIACDFSDFSGAISTDSSNTVIKGYIGSKTTMKLLNDGLTFS